METGDPSNAENNVGCCGCAALGVSFFVFTVFLFFMYCTGFLLFFYFFTGNIWDGYGMHTGCIWGHM